MPTELSAGPKAASGKSAITFFGFFARVGFFATAFFGFFARAGFFATAFFEAAAFLPAAVFVFFAAVLAIMSLPVCPLLTVMSPAGAPC